MDNRWIVKYNPYLSEKFGAHINVEACPTIKIVKYPFKYVYKGYDCANIEVKETTELNHDGISTFLDARYVSAPGGYWRLSEFKMHDHSHAIIRLPVHLPRQQPVYFQRGKHEVAVNNIADADTMLTAFFKHNNLSQTGLRYSEFPLHFVFNKSLKKWQARKKKCNIIARMYSVSPKDIERYSLRLLLLHIPGPMCLMIYALWITTRLIHSMKHAYFTTYSRMTLHGIKLWTRLLHSKCLPNSYLSLPSYVFTVNQQMPSIFGTILRHLWQKTTFTTVTHLIQLRTRLYSTSRVCCKMGVCPAQSWASHTMKIYNPMTLRAMYSVRAMYWRTRKWQGGTWYCLMLNRRR